MDERTNERTNVVFSFFLNLLQYEMVASPASAIDRLGFQPSQDMTGQDWTGHLRPASRFDGLAGFHSSRGDDTRAAPYEYSYHCTAVETRRADNQCHTSAVKEH